MTTKKSAALAAHQHARELETELVRFKTGDRNIDFNVDLTAETVWATQQQIADLYDRDKRTISEHIQAVLGEGEFDSGSVVRKFRTTASDGKSYEITHYDLDIILAIGFRVKSPKAAQFRKWAYQTLRSYLIDGFAINERRLRDDPHALRALAARIRRLRSDERNIYAAVRECFKVSSSDYDKDSPACRSFYAKLQDKLLYAASESTAGQILLTRANHTRASMGITTKQPDEITVEDAKVSKNYLDENELYRLHMIAELFLLFAENKAIQGKALTMKEMGQKLDELLRFHDYPVFREYRDYLGERPRQHATAEFALYRRQLTKAKARLAQALT